MEASVLLVVEISPFQEFLFVGLSCRRLRSMVFSAHRIILDPVGGKAGFVGAIRFST